MLSFGPICCHVVQIKSRASLVYLIWDDTTPCNKPPILQLPSTDTHRPSHIHVKWVLEAFLGHLSSPSSLSSVRRSILSDYNQISKYVVPPCLGALPQYLAFTLKDIINIVVMWDVYSAVCAHKVRIISERHVIWFIGIPYACTIAHWARICKCLRSPGIDFASLCSLAGRYVK